jgi:diguanylate cyclase (GGDEF)-like protein
MAGRWVLAGLVGMTVSGAVVHGQPLGSLPAAGHIILGAACGWLLMLAVAPWRHMRRLEESRRMIRGIAAQLRELNVNRREAPISNIVLDRDDELGELSRVIHAALSQAIANRIEARMLHRTMHEQVRRETDRATHHLQRQASTDALTGLGNRRALEARLGELLASERAGALPVCAMAIDVDLFKEINDALGHEAGDQCLVFLGQVLASSLRRDDLAVRLGGDEFVVVMPGRTASDARPVAERLAALFRQMPWPHGAVPRPTLSIGLASMLPGEEPEAQDLLRRADAALYHSKRTGRARITVERELRGAA